MSETRAADPRVVIQSIDPQGREVMAEWLEAHAAQADVRAREMAVANRSIKDPVTARNVVYWEHVACSGRYFAELLRRSGKRPDRAPGGPKHVRREPGS